ncbi:hypothetical protein [Loktanella sp. Alg231-35]|uniref:hypothetical protein n=1 Tax=Loktanella sp. Alg231-35 TaxID=1922220 RepID=UPI001F2DDA24|nr:hypothetical protein [Loktanella sp. Alg231-35]
MSDKAKQAEGLTQGEAIALAFCFGWIVVVGMFFWTLPEAAEGLRGLPGPMLILMPLAIILPVALIAVAGLMARANRKLRKDIGELGVAYYDLRNVQIAQAGMQNAPVQTATPQAAEHPAAPPPTSRFTSRREVSRLIVPRAAPQAPADQPALAFEAPAEDTNPPLERPDLIQALNFPNDENDTEGFAALRRALRDRSARKLVQASQDVLTLLSQDGIYMDDLRPDPVEPALWRRFAKGERGQSVDRLGAIRHHDAQIAIAGRAREDTIFRDAVHHFLRCFDQMLITFEEHATDTDLLQMAETRTARAFMLLGRATGTFD